ncbi:MAG: RNA polymerase sigma factor [Planctomycetota bacterium]|jgi:hypothetical protein
MTPEIKTSDVPLAQSEQIAQRVALLLTADSTRADDVLGVVLASQPDLRHVDIARVRRLVILRAREDRFGSPPRKKPWLVRVRERHLRARGEALPAEQQPPTEVFDGIALVAFRACERLDRQQMEAWLLHRVEDLDLRQAARAMDCSTSALQRHLERAEASLGQTLGGEYVEAIERLRAQSRGVETLPSLRWMRDRVRRSRATRRVVVGIALVLLLLGVTLAVLLLV